MEAWSENRDRDQIVGLSREATLEVSKQILIAPQTGEAPKEYFGKSGKANVNWSGLKRVSPHSNHYGPNLYPVADDYYYETNKGKNPLYELKQNGQPPIYLTENTLVQLAYELSNPYLTHSSRISLAEVAIHNVGKSLLQLNRTIEGLDFFIKNLENKTYRSSPNFSAKKELKSLIELSFLQKKTAAERLRDPTHALLQQQLWGEKAIHFFLVYCGLTSKVILRD